MDVLNIAPLVKQNKKIINFSLFYDTQEFYKDPRFFLFCFGDTDVLDENFIYKVFFCCPTMDPSSSSEVYIKFILFQYCTLLHYYTFISQRIVKIKLLHK